MKKVILIITLIFIILVVPISVKGSSVSLTENETWQANLTGVFHSSIALGDIDSDNDLDLIIMGCTAGGADTCTTADNVRIYINDGSSLVENATWEQNLTSIGYGSLVWGDIDNDGDLDLAITGDTGGGSGVVKIYVNNGTSLVENTIWQQNLTNVDAYAGSIAFGDIDNDGDLDIALVGASPNSDNGIYINNGTTFTKNSTWIENFPYVGHGLGMGALAFGDIDNDENLDLVFLGSYSTNWYRGVYVNNGISLVENSTWESFNAIFAWPSLTFGDWNNDGNLDLATIGTRGGDHFYIFENNGNTFVENTTEDEPSNACIPGYFDGSLGWGDYDNDGDLDIVVIGKEAGRARVIEQGIENDWGCTFATDATAHADISDDIVQGSLAWGDIDNDGDLDLIITGDDDGTNIAKIYINNISTANTPPNASTNFTASYSNNQLTLTWNNGSDAETSDLGLYYNLRVGNSSGGHDIVSGVYGGGDDNGYFGNMMQRKSITLKNLNLQPNQTIYWSVQTIDTGLANGSWSTEQNYTLPVDITNPVITLNAPVNNFNTSNPVITFNATVSDNMNLTNVSLYGNWSGTLALNETNSSGFNNTAYIFIKNLTSHGDGVYLWLIEAKDKTNNSINSTTRYFTIDTTAPVVTLIAPANNTLNETSNTIDFYYNVTDANNIKNCSLIINDKINSTALGIIRDTTLNITVYLNDSTYNWSINCTDYAGNTNSSAVRNITINRDETFPVINLILPTNGSSWESSSTVTFTYNVTDINNMTNCELIINNTVDQTDTTITINTSQPFSKSLSNAVYNWSVNCTDIAGNKNNSETRKLTVSYSAPSGDSSSSGGGSGGGGGGAATTTTATSETINTGRVNAGGTAKAEFTAELGITDIEITVKQTVTASSITVVNQGSSKGIATNAVTYNEISSNMAVHSYLKITVGKISSTNIEKAKIKFKIPIAENYNPDTVELRKYDAFKKAWSSLPTKLASQDAYNYYFEAETTSFSIFAIVGRKVVEKVKEAAINVSDVKTNVSEEIVEEEITEEEVKEEKKSKAWISLLIIGLVIIGVIAYPYVREKKKNVNKKRK